MKKVIQASVINELDTETLTRQYALPLFTIAEVAELLSTIEELKGLKISHSIEQNGNVVFSIGACEYIMVGRT